MGYKVVIPVLGSQRQEGCKLGVGYISGKTLIQKKEISLVQDLCRVLATRGHGQAARVRRLPPSVQTSGPESRS